MEHAAEPVAIHYKLSEKEYLEACHLLTFRGARTKARVALNFALLAVVFPFFLAFTGFAAPAVLAATVTLLGLLGYLHYFSNFVVPRRFYKGDRRFREGLSLTFTPEHIFAQSKLVEARMDWKLYTDVIEGESQYLLVYGKDVRMMTPIPKRAFKSRKQELAFRALVFPRFDRKLEGTQPDAAGTIQDDYQPPGLQPPDWR